MAAKSEIVGKIVAKAEAALTEAQKSWDTKRVDWVLARVSTLKEIVETSYIEMTELLHEVAEKMYWSKAGYISFEDFCQNALGFGNRKGWYLVSIFRNLIRDAHVKKTSLSEIGWTTAKEIATLPKEELANGKVDKWLEKAKTMEGREFSMTIRKAKNNHKEKDEKKHSEEIFFKEEFHLDGSQLKNVDLAIQTARKITSKAGKPIGHLTRGYLLDFVCLEFNASHAEESNVKLRWILDQVARVFGVECIAVETKNGKEVVVHGKDVVKRYGMELEDEKP